MGWAVWLEDGSGVVQRTRFTASRVCMDYARLLGATCGGGWCWQPVKGLKALPLAFLGAAVRALPF